MLTADKKKNAPRSFTQSISYVINEVIKSILVLFTTQNHPSLIEVSASLRSSTLGIQIRAKGLKIKE
jgi:hypothetical protein